VYTIGGGKVPYAIAVNGVVDIIGPGPRNMKVNVNANAKTFIKILQIYR
jgi:hypothetical protein